MENITLHDHEEHYIDKSFKLNCVYIHNLRTSTSTLKVDKKLQLSQGVNTNDKIVLNLLLDGRTINIIYEKIQRIIYYDDRLYDVMEMDLGLGLK